MDVLLLVYNKSDRKSITQINHKLFGRIVSSKNKSLYYYPGLLENVMYCKIANGCYFIMNEGNVSIEINELYSISPVIITSPETFKFINAHDYWYNYAQNKSIKVKNLNG